MLIVTALLVVAVGTAGVTGQCSAGFESVGGRCLSFHSGVSTPWQDARSYCANINNSTSKLIILDEPDLHRSVYEYIKTYTLSGSFWLGASDQDYEGDWKWVDNSRVDRGSPYWALETGVLGWDQEPLGGSNENCLALDEDKLYYFNDMPCSNNFHVICQEF